MTFGSHGQPRSHPAMAEIQVMSTESRLLEIELGFTPAAASKAGVPAVSAPVPFHMQSDDDAECDPRITLIRTARKRRLAGAQKCWPVLDQADAAVVDAVVGGNGFELAAGEGAGQFGRFVDRIQ